MSHAAIQAAAKGKCKGEKGASSRMSVCSFPCKDSVPTSAEALAVGLPSIALLKGRVIFCRASCAAFRRARNPRCAGKGQDRALGVLPGVDAKFVQHEHEI